MVLNFSLLFPLLPHIGNKKKDKIKDTIDDNVEQIVQICLTRINKLSKCWDIDIQKDLIESSYL